MKEDLISVIIPIYNVEKYLNKCVDSVISQNYKNIEIILVDDGSPDKCGKICDEYSKRDNRIKVIHKENGGLSDARNVGIENAKGKYITFIDSDDYVEKDYIKLLYEAIMNNGVLISQCGIRKILENNQLIEEIGYKENFKKTSSDMMIDLYNGKWENIVVWNKMYLKELFQDIKFPKGKIHEDEFTTYKIFFKTEKIAIISNCLYNYRQNLNSITGKKFDIKRLDVIEALEERMKFLEEKKEQEILYLTLAEYLLNIRNNYLNVKLYIKNSEIIQKALIKKYRKNYLKIIKNRKFKIVKKIKWGIFYFTPNLWFFLRYLKINIFRID